MDNNRDPNDGGIKRGDGVGPDGSGVRVGDDGPGGMPTADPSSETEVLESTGHGGGDIEGLTIVDATDPSLGLTGIGEIPADDWAADTGPARNAAAGRGVSTNRMNDLSSTLSGKR